MTTREQEEYTALRATIRERGTARVYIFALGLSLWAVMTLALLALALPPLAVVIPLTALAGTYEAVLALHVGVERIGRYLMVRHADGWERVAGSFGRPAGSLSVDPLFPVPFVLAAVLTTMPLLAAGPILQELLAVGLAEAAFIARVLLTRAAAGRQRAVDTERFRTIADPSAPSA